tara:strand:- start:698 stop:1162 length:465 start_codon:yes stop_codon:yes gene_type:complete
MWGNQSEKFLIIYFKKSLQIINMENLKSEMGDEDIENKEELSLAAIKEEIEQQKVLGLGVSSEGFKCLDENGQEMLIKRAKKHVDGSQYKFTLEQRALCDTYLIEAKKRYPNIEPGVLNVLVEDFVKFPDKVHADMIADEEYMENIITEEEEEV